MFPTADLESKLLADYDFVIGVDEVGRGAIAGPVAVGAVAVTLKQLDSWPRGIRDSKLVPETKRSGIAVEIRDWAMGEVGFAGVEEIEKDGIVASLAAAAVRAIRGVFAAGLPETDRVMILLDGSHDWLSSVTELPVHVVKKADLNCISVAAASLLAKVARDSEMLRLDNEHPEFGFSSNKGYASGGHVAALRTVGPSAVHRKSWLGKILQDGQLF